MNAVKWATENATKVKECSRSTTFVLYLTCRRIDNKTVGVGQKQNMTEDFSCRSVCQAFQHHKFEIKQNKTKQKNKVTVLSPKVVC